MVRRNDETHKKVFGLLHDGFNEIRLVLGRVAIQLVYIQIWWMGHTIHTPGRSPHTVVGLLDFFMGPHYSMAWNGSGPGTH